MPAKSHLPLFGTICARSSKSQRVLEVGDGFVVGVGFTGAFSSAKQVCDCFVHVPAAFPVVGEQFDLFVDASGELSLYGFWPQSVQLSTLSEEQRLVGGFLCDDVLEDVGERAYASPAA